MLTFLFFSFLFFFQENKKTSFLLKKKVTNKKNWPFLSSLWCRNFLFFSLAFHLFFLYWKLMPDLNSFFLYLIQTCLTLEVVEAPHKYNKSFFLSFFPFSKSKNKLFFLDKPSKRRGLNKNREKSSKTSFILLFWCCWFFGYKLSKGGTTNSWNFYTKFLLVFNFNEIKN